MTNRSGTGPDDTSWWSGAPIRHRVIAAVVGVCVGVVVAAIGSCAAASVGKLLLDSSAPPPLPGPPLSATFVWYGFVPIGSLTGITVGIAAGLASTRLSLWLAQENTREAR